MRAGCSGRHLDADAFGVIAFEFDYLPPWLNPPRLLNDEDFNALNVDLTNHVLAKVPLGGANLEIRTAMHGSWSPHVDLHQSTTIWVQLDQAGIEPTRVPSLSDIVGMGSNTLLWVGESPLNA